MSLENIVNVQISKTGKGVTQVGFGTPLIVGSSSRISPDLIRSYQTLADVASDFQTSDPEYLAAVAILSQNPHPTTLKIGRRTGSDVAQVDHVTVANVQDSHQYGISINGNHATFTSGVGATAGTILAGLKTAIDALSLPITTLVVGTTLNITANVAGAGFTDVPDTADLVVTNSTANYGVANDLAAIQAVDDDWYGFMLTSRLDIDILDAAAWCETQFKIFIACSSDVNSLSLVATSDVAYKIHALKYARTAMLWSDSQALFPDAAWLGAVLPLTPGSETWAFKSLTGVVASKLSPTGIQALKARSANYYITIAGVDIVLDGVVTDAEYVDSIRFIDSFQKGAEQRIFSVLVNSPKIPYTDQGIAIIEAQVQAQILNGISVGGIATDPAPTVTAVAAAAVNPNDRSTRFYSGLSFSWRLAGAIQKIQINGTVSV